MKNFFQHFRENTILIGIICNLIAMIIGSLAGALWITIKEKTSFWETLISFVQSRYFLILIIIVLICYIIIDTIIRNRKKNAKEVKIDGCYSWKDIEEGVDYLKNKLLSDEGYIPTYIVGIGRGGAVISALLSGNTLNNKHIPFIALEREYEEEAGVLKAKLFDAVQLNQDLSKVLLVASDVFTGDTASLFMNYLIQLGANEIKFLVFTKVNSTKMEPNFYYKSTSVTELKFPWMLTDNYVKDARKA